MAPRKKKEVAVKPAEKPNAYIAGAGTVVDQAITDTLRTYFMP